MSYLKHFEIKEPAFANVPDLRFFYNRPPYDETLNRINSAIDSQKRVIVVIGGCGLGKTIISRSVLNKLEDNDAEYEVGLLVCLHSDMGSGWLLQKLALQMHLDIKENDTLFERVADQYMFLGSHGKHVVLIIDEASMIENQAVYDEIRGLVDFMADNKFKFTVIFFGMPTLEGKLAFNEPLLHRVEQRIVLKPLPTTQDVKKYIDHRMTVAGAKRQFFTDTAIHRINETAKGNPRIINIIADNALTEAYLTKQEFITEKEVDRVIIEMGYNTRLKSLFLDVAKAAQYQAQQAQPAPQPPPQPQAQEKQQPQDQPPSCPLQ